MGCKESNQTNKKHHIRIQCKMPVAEYFYHSLFICQTALLMYLYFCSAEGKAKMATILDQKNYLEELNRHLK